MWEEGEWLAQTGDGVSKSPFFLESSLELSPWSLTSQGTGMMLGMYTEQKRRRNLSVAPIHKRGDVAF